MFKIFLLFLAGLFFITGMSYGLELIKAENYIFSLDAYLRNDVISFKNVVDLDNRNKDDTTTYLGIDYNVSGYLEFKDFGPTYYLKLERNGPGDYDAPLFVHNTLMTSGGVIEEYRNDELLPQVEEFWLDMPLVRSFRFKSGLYTYEVGNGFSLNGAYENYGFSLYQEQKNFTLRIYYCRPDVMYKNHLGPRIRQDQEQGYVYNHNASNFFATDVKFDLGKNVLWPYLGVLADYTAPNKRDRLFTQPIKRDILGTLGMSWSFEHNNLSLKTELAHNFGKALTSDREYKDIYHTGYMAYADIDYHLGKFIPTLQFFLGSGNKTTLDMAKEGATTLTSSKNRAFSCYSPLNKNLGDSISASHADIRPMVAMASGYGLNFGVSRPRSMCVSDFDNIVILLAGCTFEITKKLTARIYGYRLRTFSRPVGTLDGEGKYLSKDLGDEIDLFCEYRINKNILFNFQGGYFLPGHYYKERRDDISGSVGTLNPYLRGDGDADSAYQLEFSLEFQF